MKQQQVIDAIEKLGFSCYRVADEKRQIIHVFTSRMLSDEEADAVAGLMMDSEWVIVVLPMELWRDDDGWQAVAGVGTAEAS